MTGLTRATCSTASSHQIDIPAIETRAPKRFEVTSPFIEQPLKPQKLDHHFLRYRVVSRSYNGFTDAGYGR